MQDLASLYMDSPPVELAWSETNHCAACYSLDDRWYRAVITEVEDAKETKEAQYKVSENMMCLI